MRELGRYRQRLRIGVLFAVAIVCVAGCGGPDRPKTIPISGLVTIDGKTPDESGKLFFTPTKAAEGYSLRPASGSFNAQGKYRVMSWAPDDGLVPGHYTVSVMPGDAGKTKIPTKYFQSGTSGLEVDVPMDESEINFNVDVRTK